ncbi:peptidoglycan recognition protein [Streptomyces sp. MUM 2J]|uniref:peptidoglycan recognition protein family protein n=1 Tax=Streptomyces sp. MUM 2J TaxID=2791987 RepID=UPI001F03A0F9|nr:peptidoglycan recognition protein [Streptomyces sp. MUM 2J]MCH0567126.1 peptidoglycan recognition protein [Streptomyces sp. MUM 2J]
MRGLLASSIGAACALALALPSTPPAAAAPAVAGTRRAPAAGATQSLPLVPLHRNLHRSRALQGPGGEQGLPRRDVRHFSLLGVVWDDPDAELHGRVRVRTRAAATGTWSGWQDVETHNADHGADPGSAERAAGRVRGGTAPLWVGDSDGVEVRVRAAPTRPEGRPEAPVGGAVATAGRAAAPLLPTGLRVELVDPGAAPAPAAAPALTGGARAVSAANAGLAGVSPGATEIPALDRERTELEMRSLPGVVPAGLRRAKPKIGPRPRVVTRRGWGADERMRQKRFVYTGKVRAAFVHHTVTGNNYRCSQAPSVIRGIYRYHVRSMGWRDIGYNFVVDKCGTIYEGRAGGVAKPVLGAHTLGFNTDSMGIAVLGTFTSTRPSSAAVKAIARLTAWKLGLYGMNPRGKTYLKSGGGNLYRKGRKVRLNVISGHRDGYATECPGRKLYGRLGSARSTAAQYQGR